MIITRTGEMVEFRLGDDRPIQINVSRITSAALTAERAPCGKLALVLVLIGTAVSAQRIVAGPLQLTAMHARIL